MAAVWASFCLPILLAALALSPHRAYGSAWDSLFGRKQDAAAAPTVGICESSVVVYGYPCQEFEVTTQDGYILSLQRIPEGRGNGSGGGGGGEIKKPPVLIQHGVLVLNGLDNRITLLRKQSRLEWVERKRILARSFY